MENKQKEYTIKYMYKGKINPNETATFENLEEALQHLQDNQNKPGNPWVETNFDEQVIDAFDEHGKLIPLQER